jgi:hypothetical protein
MISGPFETQIAFGQRDDLQSSAVSPFDRIDIIPGCLALGGREDPSE